MTAAATAPVPAPVTSTMRLACPHCGAGVRIRTTLTISPTLRESVTECRNHQCGWRGKMHTAFVAEYTPSATPREGINLPATSGNPVATAAQHIAANQG